MVVGAREEWGVDVKWHMSGRDHFETTLTAFLQDTYFPEGDVDKRLKSAGWILWWICCSCLREGSWERNSNRVARDKEPASNMLKRLIVTNRIFGDSI